MESQKNNLKPENFVELNAKIDYESKKIRDVLIQMQSLKELPTEERQKKLQQIITTLHADKTNRKIDDFLNLIDDSLDEFIGDPRKFVYCITKILESIKTDPDKTHNIITRFLQEKKIEHLSSTDHFDCSLVDILLTQLISLYGGDAKMTKEMCDSIDTALFSSSEENHYLRQLISQFLLLSVGEKLTTVKHRMYALSVAPLSKVSMLANAMVEIYEKYETRILDMYASCEEECSPKETNESNI